MRHVIQKCMFTEKVGLESHRIRSSNKNDDQKNPHLFNRYIKVLCLLFLYHGNVITNDRCDSLVQ